MVQIVSEPEILEAETTETDPTPDKLKPVVKNTKAKRIKPKKIKSTLSRKGPSAKELEYAQMLQVFIEKNRFYPRPALRLKQQGTVVVSLTILQDGTFSTISLIEESKHTTLNNAALSFLKDLEKFKPLPDSSKVKQEYIIPIFYKIGG